MYRPNTPNVKSINPEKKQIVTIKLVNPSTLIPPVRYLETINIVYRKESIVTDNPSLIINFRGLSEYVIMISNAKLISLLQL